MRSIKRVRKVPLADKQLLAELKEKVLQYAPDAELILYGSAARGTRQPDSDYDVLVLTGESLPRDIEQRLRDAIHALELDREVVLSAFIYTREEWLRPFTTATPLYRNVQKEGVVL